MRGGYGETPADFAQAAREMAEAKGILPTLQGVVSQAVALLPCQWAAVAAMDELTDRPARLTANNDDALAKDIAEIAGSAGDSPGIVAFRTGRVVVCHDLTTEARFTAYAREVVARTPVRSVLSIPLTMHGVCVGVLSCYADSTDVFDEQAVEAGEVLAVHGVVAIVAAREEGRADNLEIALLSSRTIGAALGILIERFKITPDDAWARLRAWSQDQNRPVVDLAGELVETGVIDEAALRAPSRPPATHSS